MWFQQDGATAYNARINMRRLQQLYPQQLIHNLTMSSGLPNLTTYQLLDFSLELPQSKDFSTRQQTIGEFQAAIPVEIAAIP